MIIDIRTRKVIEVRPPEPVVEVLSVEARILAVARRIDEMTARVRVMTTQLEGKPWK